MENFFIAFRKMHHVIYYIVSVSFNHRAVNIFNREVNLFPSRSTKINEILAYLGHIFPDYLCRAGMLFVPSLYN